MSGADHRRTRRARDLAEERADGEHVGAVESRGRLVRDDNSRPYGDRARELHPPALASRELLHGPVRVLLEPNGRERLLASLALEAAELERELDVLPGVEEGDETGNWPTRASRVRRR